MTTVEIPQDQDEKLFGTDGVRGKAGQGPITPEVFAGLGYAQVEYLREQGHEDPCIVFGRDPRQSGQLLAEAAMCGVLAAGGRVINVGILPTPGVQRIAQEEAGVAGGAMVTASHNPFEDNGIKLFFNAFKPTEEEAWALTRRFWQQERSGLVIPTTLDRSRVESRPEAREAYISDIVDSIRETFGKAEPLKDTLFVVDCANGAAMDISPVVFERLGAEVIRFGSDPSAGINDNCGSEHLQGLKEYLAAHPEITSNPKFVGAVAHDGDADRGNGIGFFRGKLLEVSGSHILEALAQYPKQPGVVGNIYINSAAKRRILEQGIGFEYCANGDTAVTQALLARQKANQEWTRGAEHTAHSMLTNWLTSGDGTYAMAWYAAWAVTVKKAGFGEIVSQMPMLPTKELKIPTNGLAIPENISDHPRAATIIAEVLAELGGDGRAVVRPSGTQPIFRVMVESLNQSAIEAAAQRIGTEIMALAVSLQRA